MDSRGKQIAVGDSSSSVSVDANFLASKPSTRGLRRDESLLRDESLQIIGEKSNVQAKPPAQTAQPVSKPPQDTAMAQIMKVTKKQTAQDFDPIDSKSEMSEAGNSPSNQLLVEMEMG